MREIVSEGIHQHCEPDISKEDCEKLPGSISVRYYWVGCEFSKEGSKQAVTCNSQDGRCIDCQTNVNIPGGNYLLTFYLSDRDTFIANDKPLRVCSSGYTADREQGSNKCVACDSATHKEISAEFGDTPDNKCESADFNYTYGDQGLRGTYCTASLECDERYPGSWCNDNIRRTCDPNCQYSEESCRTDAEEDDDGIRRDLKGTCTDYSGCVLDHCEEIVNTDFCHCFAECWFENPKNCPITTISKCSKILQPDSCNNDPECVWGLREYYVEGDECKTKDLRDSKCSDGLSTCFDLNNDGSINIVDIAIVAKAFGTYPGHPKWNPVADLDYNYKIDIRDIARVAKQFGQEC
jgi:hypothetical protein